MDLFDLNGTEFMVTVDYYSRSFEVERLTSKTAEEVVNKLKAPPNETWGSRPAGIRQRAILLFCQVPRVRKELWIQTCNKFSDISPVKQKSRECSEDGEKPLI